MQANQGPPNKGPDPERSVGHWALRANLARNGTNPVSCEWRSFGTGPALPRRSASESRLPASEAVALPPMLRPARATTAPPLFFCRSPPPPSVPRGKVVLHRTSVQCQYCMVLRGPVGGIISYQVNALRLRGPVSCCGNKSILPAGPHPGREQTQGCGQGRQQTCEWASKQQRHHLGLIATNNTGLLPVASSSCSSPFRLLRS
jgi:hypothetical protein